MRRQGSPTEAPGAAAEGGFWEPEGTAGDLSAGARASGPLGGSGSEGGSPDTGATALGTQGAPASPALPAGKAVPPLARPVAATPPPLTQGQKVSFRRDGVVVQGRVTGLLGSGGFIVETADDVEVLRASDLTVLASVPKQGKTGKQGQSAGTSLSGKAKEPRPPRPAPLPPVFVDGKLLPSPEWVPEDHGNETGAAYEVGIPGGVRGWAPRLSATDAEGTVTAKYDGVEGNTVIERKTSIRFFKRSIKQALKQSAVAAKNGYKIRWEVPNEREKKQAERLFREWGIKNIEVAIHPKQ